MEDVVLASASNPAHRRNEMMACVKGLELIAEMRGDCAMFYTITCPSKYHATLMNGKPNPTWDHSTVRKSSDYLVDTFAAFRKAMHKKAALVRRPRSRTTSRWHCALAFIVFYAQKTSTCNHRAAASFRYPRRSRRTWQ
jgi:ribonuclease HI